MSKYSIIIPTYKHLSDCLIPCINSIKKYTDFSRGDIEVIVVANGCGDDGTREYLEGLTKAKYAPALTQTDFSGFDFIWIEEQVGYTKAVNRGIHESTGEYIILLNNDTVLLDQPINQWIEMLVAPFKQPIMAMPNGGLSKRVAVTGPMLTHCPSANREFLIFFCAMIKRSVIDDIGMLDEAFAPAYGEDTDFCCRAVDAGYQIVQVPCESNNYYADKRMVGAFPIYHEGNVSYKNWPDGDKLLEKNNNILRERYNKPKAVEETQISSSECQVPSAKCPAPNISNALKCDGFMTDAELLWLATQAQHCKVVIEVGSWHGKSSRAIADNLPPDGVLYCVDTWNGSEFEKNTWHASAKMMEGDHALYEFLQNNLDLVQSGKIIPLRMSSKNASALMKEKGIKADMIFIDAGHTYNEVMDDLQRWNDVVKPRGIFCGHDYIQVNWMQVKEAVDSYFNSLSRQVFNRPNTSIWFSINSSMTDKPKITNTLTLQPQTTNAPSSSTDQPQTENANTRQPNIYACFPFFNELDVLDVYFAETFDVVDRYVIAEATVTHQGSPKPLYFKENLKRYEKYLHKVTHIVVEDMPTGPDNWARERHQRDALMRGLTDLKDNDILIIGDADEVPSAWSIKEYHKVNNETDIFRLKQFLYYYYYNCRATEVWEWAKILRWRRMKHMTPCEVRYDKTPNHVYNAGWHFSYIGDTSKIIEKIKASAHAEYNTPEFTNPQKVAQLVNEGKDVFGRPLEYKFVDIDESYPAYIKENIAKFKFNKLIHTKPLPVPNILHSTRGLDV